MPVTRAECLARDHADPLARCRERFSLPAGVIYLDGNSLGALPGNVADRVANAVTEQWGQGLIRSWNDAGWYEAPARAGARLAPLIGAQAHEVVITDTISINLFKLLVAACRMRPDRRVILAEAGNFPSDNYIVGSVAQLLGLTVRAVPADEIAGAIGSDIAVVTLSQVHYKTAALQDMAAVTRRAHDHGALILWDLAHSTGALAVDLNAAKADFAVGCGYKYLNGGPGAPAHLFVAERHLPALDQPLTGWFGHRDPFRFDADYDRADGIRHMLCSTPQMLSLAAFEAALAVFDGIAMTDLAAKGRAMGDLMVALFDQKLAPLGCRLLSPREGGSRGNHVSIGHDAAYPVMQALIARGIIGDFRAPDAMRFGFAPLYLRHVDIYDAVAALADIIAGRQWDHPAYRQRGAVT